MINVIFNNYKYDLTNKKLETYDKYCKILQWGRRNPVAFIETFMNIQLLDHQKYVFLNSWIASTVAWLMSRSSGKSYLTSPFIMARSILIPNHNTYCMAPSGPQAQMTFKKLEDLSKGNIASVLGVSSFFLDECVRANPKADPFTHSKTSHTVTLYNGSTINSLNSVAKNIVGVRSNLNVYDEAGKIERDFYALTEPFTAQSTDFATGGSLNTELFPRQMPNKNLYLSSAEGQDSHLFEIYKNCFENMMQGNRNYFVCDLDCTLSLHPFLNGKPTKPLVSQQVIDDAFATNPYKANREYFNLWDNDSGPNAFVKRTTITKFTQTYYPTFKNDGNKIYIIAYDPASKNDNSFTLVAELIDDEEMGLMAKIVYARNLVEKLKNNGKAHIQKPEQLDIIKQMTLDYNAGHDEYQGIERLIIDAGAGGGGFDMGQYLMRDWNDKDGKRHRAWIDLEDPNMSLRADDYPGNCDKLTMFNFKRDKTSAYERTQSAINQGLIIFPAGPNYKNELEFSHEKADGTLEVIYEKLDQDSLASWQETELMKEEILAMQKVKRQNGTVTFDTSPEGKSKNLGDDRADCLAMICWYLMGLRATRALEVEQTVSEYVTYFAKAKTDKNGVNRQSPFGNVSNPFKNSTNIFK